MNMDWFKPGALGRVTQSPIPLRFVHWMFESNYQQSSGRQSLERSAGGAGGPTLSHFFFADDMVLFSEATLEQLEVIKKCLEEFSAISGKKLTSKSLIYFSRSKLRNLQQRRSQRYLVYKGDWYGQILGNPALVYNNKLHVTPYIFYVICIFTSFS